MSDSGPGTGAYPAGVLPDGIRARSVRANGLDMHVLEAGYEDPGRPCILLLHGFPELAFSWRKNMVPLARQGYHVIAPDLRGFGRTTGWETGYDIDLAPFGNQNLVLDMICLVTAMGHREVRMVAGHDCGVQVAAHAALIRPDIFRSAVFMSAPFMGLAELETGEEKPGVPLKDIPAFRALGTLARPRKHYQLYYSARQAAADMDQPLGGMARFLRGYFYSKSADWPGNRPRPLQSWEPEEFAGIPTYYIMDADRTMPETVVPYLEELGDAPLAWLTEQELGVYAGEYERTGFQGGLNWYRVGTGGENLRQTRLFRGRRVEVPVCFIAGAADWGPYQLPGFLEKQARACTDLRGCHFVDRAGHWVQQEQPEQVNRLLLDFLGTV